MGAPLNNCNACKNRIGGGPGGRDYKFEVRGGGNSGC